MIALLVLEYRYALHNVAAVLRSPWRVTLWGAYVLFLGGGIVSRILLLPYNGSWRQAHLPHSATLTLAPAIAGMLALSLGGTLVGAAFGRVTTFRTRAEALLFSNGGVSPLTIALWLQARRIASTFGRRMLTIAFYGVVFLPQRFANPQEAAFALAGVLAALATLLGLELPVYLLARRGWMRALVAIGAVVAAYGATYGTASFLAVNFNAHFALVALHYLPINLGAFARSVVGGNVIALATLCALPFLLVAAAVLLGRDAIPELFGAAEGGLAQRIATRRKGRGDAYRIASGETTHVPPGALAIIWKDWLAVRRARGAAQAWAVGTFLAVAVSTAAAWAVREAGGPAAGAPLIGGALAMLILAPIGTARGLAADFGKPIWWLGKTRLRSRVHALVFARAWRGSLVLALSLFSAALIFGNDAVAVAAPVIAFALMWSLGALGTALYALFPYDLDRRGPLLLVRTIAVALYFAPVAAIGGLLVIAGVPLAFALLASAAVLGAEGAAAIEIASVRISENGAGLANLERVT